MQHTLVRRGPVPVALVSGASCLLALAGLAGCNSLTGAGDLVITGSNGSSDHGTESSATSTASNEGVGGSGVGESGVGGGAVGPAGVGGAVSSAGGSSVVSSSPSSTPASSTATTTTTANSGPTTTGAGGGTSSDPTQLCVDTINNFRKTRSLPPMTRWTSEETCVDGEAMTDGTMMSAHYDFIHGQTCGADAENECPGWSTNPLDSGDGIVACLTQMWGEKNQAGCAGCDTCDFPYTGAGCTNCDFDGTTVCGHYLNMKSSVLSTVACGFWSGGWYTQNFM